MNWDKAKTWIVGVTVGWALLLLTLDLVGLVDIQTDCPTCAKVIEKVLSVPDAKASPHGSEQERIEITSAAPIRIRVSLLP